MTSARAAKAWLSCGCVHCLPLQGVSHRHLSDHLSDLIETTLSDLETAKIIALDREYSRFCCYCNTHLVSLQGVSHRHLSDHLSDLIETTLSELETAKIIAIDEEDDNLEALNSAMISGYYYLDYRTVELFQNSLTAKTKLKGLLEIISAASEFDELSVRPGEEESVEKLLRHAKLAITRPEYGDPHTKANALIQVSGPVYQLFHTAHNKFHALKQVSGPCLQKRPQHLLLLCIAPVDNPETLQNCNSPDVLHNSIDIVLTCFL